MILSHRHRFIFIKTAKTAGTSLEFALATLCGPEDVVTPVSAKEERARGEHGARNWIVPLHRRPLRWFAARALGRADKWDGAEFYNHIGAKRIRELVGADVWSGYLKIAVERNPWDREVSNYFYRTRRTLPKPSFRGFVLDPAQHYVLKNFHAYTIDGRIAVDRVLRYETLAEDFARLVRDLGLRDVPDLPRQKSGLRPSGVHYRTYYDDETRDAVARIYRREIEAFGYDF